MSQATLITAGPAKIKNMTVSQLGISGYTGLKSAELVERVLKERQAAKARERKTKSGIQKRGPKQNLKEKAVPQGTFVDVSGVVYAAPVAIGKIAALEKTTMKPDIAQIGAAYRKKQAAVKRLEAALTALEEAYKEVADAEREFAEAKKVEVKSMQEVFVSFNKDPSSLTMLLGMNKAGKYQ